MRPRRRPWCEGRQSGAAVGRGERLAVVNANGAAAISGVGAPAVRWRQEECCGWQTARRQGGGRLAGEHRGAVLQHGSRGIPSGRSEPPAGRSGGSRQRFRRRTGDPLHTGALQGPGALHSLQGGGRPRPRTVSGGCWNSTTGTARHTTIWGWFSFGRGKSKPPRRAMPLPAIGGLWNWGTTSPPPTTCWPPLPVPPPLWRRMSMSGIFSTATRIVSTTVCSKNSITRFP